MSVGLYSAFWCAVALVVNTRGWSSATNAVACLAVWLGVVVVVPSGIQTAAQLAYPMPARAELVVAVREAASRLEPDAREILARHDARYPELRPAGGRRVPDRVALQYAVLQEQEQRLSPLLAQFEAQRTRREGLVTWLRPLSPALMVQGIIDDIAGTGPGRYRDFLQAVARYHGEWRAFFLGRVYRGERRHRAGTTRRSRASRSSRTRETSGGTRSWPRQVGLVVAVAITGARRSPAASEVPW